MVRKLNYKHGTHTVNEHLGHTIILSNTDSYPNSYWGHRLEDVEVIIFEDGELEINAKRKEWDSYLSGRKVEDVDLSKFDLSIYKDEKEYTRYQTRTCGWFKKKTEKLLSGSFLYKERFPYHQRTNVKWTIITDDGFNFNQ